MIAQLVRCNNITVKVVEF